MNKEEDEELVCTYCGRADFGSKSGHTLHVKKCAEKFSALAESHDGPYNYVGGPLREDKQKGVFELIVDEFVKTIDPNRYYVTSGEAVAKAEALEKDLWRAAGDARRLVKILKETRGEALRLECGWSGEGRLILKQKNPRKKKKQNA